MKKHFLKVALGLIGLMGALVIGVVNAQEINKDIKLEATSTAANQKIKISKYFANAYTVDWGDGSPIETVSADKTHTYTGTGTYTITLSTTADRWTFRNVYSALVPKTGTTMLGIKVTYMPSLADGFGTNATNPGDYFFQGFNEYGAIESLPEGSFDTSNIEKAGVGFFSYFNKEGKLKNLPDESFDISNITSTQIGFFAHFNIRGALESIPEGSFDTSNIVSIGDYFFGYFNVEGTIESLPEGSFKFSTGLTTVGNYFFYAFNLRGAIESLPEGSFDTSHITSVGNSFFDHFNYEGALISLPDGSFNLSKITTVGNDFFTAFNYNGALERVGENSFKLSTGATTVGDNFFYAFNQGGKSLTGLSVGSFDTSHIISVGTGLFKQFNREGGLTSLPENSFKFSTGLTTVGDSFFRSFNYSGALESLPDGSFDTSHVTSVGNEFFYMFNYKGELNSLPDNSFDISNITSVGNSFFHYFNGYGAIESIGENSFKLSTGLTTVGDSFFRSFNYKGVLESLPDGSFDTSHITSVGDGFFQSFNYQGAVEGLPDGSFDTSNITSAGDMFFYYFNENGSITYLPDSFTMNSVRSSSSGYDSSFNSTGHTFNRKVSDLLRGLDVPETDMDTFSDNQPGRCGVHANWLVSTANACSISYDDGVGGTGGFKYAADTTGVVVGSGITIPTRAGYIFDGWTNASGDIVEEVSFPEMDGQTLYAKREANEYTITIDIDGNETILTGKYGDPISKPADPSKNGYKFIGWELEFPTTMPLGGATVKAKWEKLGSSGGGGGRSNKTSDTQDSQQSGENSSAEQASATPQNDSSVSSGTDARPAELDKDLKGDTQNSSDKSSSEGQTYTQEFQEAYEFAKEKGITTMPTIQKADMDGKLTRIAMAKMLSYYAINVLGQKPDETRINKFNDITEKLDSQYDSGVTLAYQLGIMGQNMPNNKFRPNDEVTRAEFVTALSRMLYNTSDGEYRSTPKYYTYHMEKMEGEGIITNTNPNMKELRGYVMIMLMRSAK